MGKTLIIAEKPSVASDIAKALGGFKKAQDYYESDEYVLSSAIGHLLELQVPAGVEPARGKWSFAHLPVIPPHFELKPIDKTESRLKLLLKLLKRKDVSAIVNACDAGREGELIFRYIVQFAGTSKPLKRLWLQSMTAASIREAFEKLRSDEELQPLADAAVCRSEADWLVGINGTRAMTAFNSRSGGFHKTTVGRVQTPTLAILTEREAKIRAFKPRDYWEVNADFGCKAGEYRGRWFDEAFAKPKGSEDPDLKAERLWDAKKAEAIRAKCAGKPGVVTEQSKPTTQAPPMLYDLTSLQREANGRFGFSAKTTLSLAQALYEKHKVLTYPRTDSRALPENYPGVVRETLESLSKRKQVEGEAELVKIVGTAGYAGFAKEILTNKWVKPNKRIFNDEKVSDHFAIIPTPNPPKHLNELESKLYDMVVKRFLAVFYPAAEHMVTTRITRVEGEPFKTEGKVLVKAGWLAVYGKEGQGDEPGLPPVTDKEKVKTLAVEVQQSQTRPPPRYNEATLLSAMEGAGKLVEDDELREAMGAKGLGTPATRAAIIEGLIAEKYVLRLGKELKPTAKAFQLITLLNGLGVPELSSPEMTGDWEHKLKQMERGKLKRKAFMKEIEAMTRHIVQQAKAHESDTVPGDFGVLEAPCPKCRGKVKETYKTYQCGKCDFSLWKTVAGRVLEPEEVEELLRSKRVGPLEGFHSKMGRLFTAAIRLNDDLKPEFDFGDERSEEAQEKPDFTGLEPVGTCPKCQARVFEQPAAYICEKTPDKACTFRLAKVILQRPIERPQASKLLTKGKTDLLDKFISKKKYRPFSAFLVLRDGGEVGFEFAPRATTGKTPKSGEAKAAAKTVPPRKTASRR